MQYTAITSLRSQNIWQLLRYALSFVVILLSITLLALVMPYLERQLDRWALLPRHEQLTELYISNPKELPKTYTPGKTHTVTFNLHNLEARTNTYSYTLTASKLNHRVVIGKGTATLKQNESRTIRLSITLDNPDKRTHVQITLSNGQNIGYWLVRK